MSSSNMCAVCTNEGTLHCSACRAVRFCSERCLRLLWPTHKALCGRNPAVFYLPPLEPLEVELLDRVKDTAGLHKEFEGRSLVEVVTDGRAGQDADIHWKIFWQRLSAPANTDDAFEENERLKTVAAAYDILTDAVDAETLAGADPPSKRSPWHLFARFCVRYHDAYCDVVAKLSGRTTAQAAFDEAAQRGSFSVLNPLLRQELVDATIACQAYNKPSLITLEKALDLVQAGKRRTIEWLQGSDLPGPVKARLLAQAHLNFARGALGQSDLALQQHNSSS